MNTITTSVNQADVRSNKIKALIAYTARVLALTCATGPLMQTFLSSLGFDSGRIYIHTSILQAVNVLTILIFSGWVNGKNPIKPSAFSLLPTGLLFITYIPIALAQKATLPAFVCLCIIGAFQQISVGLFTVCEYKTPYYVYIKSDYGMMLSICGIASSLLSLATGAVISYLTSRIPFTRVMAIAFGFSSVLILISVLSIFLEKSLISGSEESDCGEEKRASIVSLMRLPIFRGLIAANIMRGFAAGVIGVLATIALDLGHGEALTSAMVSAQSLASLLACGIFALLAKKVSHSVFLLSGGALVCLLPLLSITGSAGYLTVYTFILFGRTLIDYSVPSLLIHSIPTSIAGPYHAWRMVLQNAGTLLATMLAARIPIPILLLISTVFGAVSCIEFYIYTKKFKQSDENPK